MCAKSKKPSKELDRPFAAAVLAQAREIAELYQVVLWQEEGHWFGRGLELPLTFGDGPTAEKAVKNTRAGLVAHVAHLLEKGQRPPAPASAGTRGEQVNVRLSTDEKQSFELAARSRGFEGLSDFIRTTVLMAIRSS